ncbi:leukocyte cell-derived chemotaxin-2-like [Pelodiscus sinensis]|uniref:leukocyte cell-derived chemotaxin-2-like n=1 Tax=Pelodiscus sinensis TaxID=13735 RepID=UPI003F6BBB79
MFPLKLIIFVALVSIVAAGPWAQICAGNPKNAIRGCDRWGCGRYNAPRPPRLHKGVDVKCTDGSEVYAPFSGVIKQATPYPRGKNTAINNGLKIEGSGYCALMFYFKPDKYNGRVTKGQRIGRMLRMQSVYPGMTSHVHVQLCNLSDPTRNL